MTDFEKQLADNIVKNYHETDEDALFYDRRMYLDMNGVLSNHENMTDILFIQYTVNQETGEDHIELFISSDDDMDQNFIYLEELSEDEKSVVFPKLLEQVQK